MRDTTSAALRALKRPGAFRRLTAAALSPLMAAATLSAARADTLAGAIAQAYQSNPTLQSARAQLRALDESYVQARAGFGPQTQLDLLGQYTKTRSPDFLGRQQVVEANAGQAQLTISQPIYTGGLVTANVTAAQRQIESGREQLRATEASVLFTVVQAYLDTQRDQDSLAVRDAIVLSLRRQLDETTARLDAGEVTRTDVAQARAQLEGERVLRAQAAAQLQVSRSAYTAAVGSNPGTLEPAPPLAGVPPTVDQAFDMAVAGNPQLRQAELTEEASRAQVEAARAAYRPTVSARGTYYYSGTLRPAYSNKFQNEIVGELSLTQPLFTSGSRASIVRQRLEQNNSDRIGIETTRRSVVQNVSNSWNGIITARSNVQTSQAELEAAQTAFDGMRIEYRDGTRSTYEVLNAEETLRDAQLQLLAARHDEYVASASLLSLVGLLEVRNIAAAVPIYDPVKNFKRVRHDGELPTDRLIEALDSFAHPGAGTRGLPTPATAPPGVAITGAATAPPLDAPLATFNPVIPSAGSTADAVRRPSLAPGLPRTN